MSGFWAVVIAVGTSILKFFTTLDIILNFLAKKTFLVLPFLAFIIWRVVQYLLSSLASIIPNYFESIPNGNIFMETVQEFSNFINFAVPLQESISIWSFVLSVFIASCAVKAIKRWIPGLSE